MNFNLNIRELYFALGDFEFSCQNGNRAVLTDEQRVSSFVLHADDLLVTDLSPSPISVPLEILRCIDRGDD